MVLRHGFFWIFVFPILALVCLDILNSKLKKYSSGTKYKNTKLALQLFINFIVIVIVFGALWIILSIFLL